MIASQISFVYRSGIWLVVVMMSLVKWTNSIPSIRRYVAGLEQTNGRVVVVHPAQGVQCFRKVKELPHGGVENYDVL